MMGHIKRLVELAFLIAFGLVEISTSAFDQYPLLMWVGAVVVLAILVDSVRCARSQWRQLREARSGGEASG
ncbi:hypothetical protein [Halorientalis sp.]|jgi:hypothetical protein|uniref:hypothetical protein n=1 Tax=Halorientalis sp. TaxID=1931229 RepID=UPI002623185B|nr:hypothetical protein [Halorientalis sp.]